MNRYAQLILVFLASGVGSVQADTVFGFYAGAGAWQQDYSGDVASGGAAIDVDELGFDSDTTNFFYAAFEHPIPGLPNVRAQYSELDLDETATLNENINFNGITFPASTEVGTTVDVTQVDAILYYELLDNVFSLDLGIAGRYLNGDMMVSSSVDDSRVDFEAVMPLLYGKARVDLPFSGFWLGAEVAGMGYDGNSLIDGNVVLGWESPFRLGVEAGWRIYSLDLQDFDDIDEANVEVSGPFAAINVHF